MYIIEVKIVNYLGSSSTSDMISSSPSFLLSSTSCIGVVSIISSFITVSSSIAVSSFIAISAAAAAAAASSAALESFSHCFSKMSLFTKAITNDRTSLSLSSAKR